MSREIKFKGKRIDNGDWVYGYYLKTGKEFYGKEKHMIAIEGSIQNYAGLDFVEVDKKTVGQYTGLKDKNNKEIYEGDVIKDSIGKEWTVGFKDGKFVRLRKDVKYYCELGGCDFSTKSENALIVETIGNIYEGVK